MQEAPPQFSPDGLFWWDGGRWVAAIRHATAPVQSSRTAYPQTSSNMRIVLLIFLGLMTVGAGFLALGFTLVVTSGDYGPLDVTLDATAIYMFGLSIAAIVGVSMRTVWAKWLAIGCGLLACWTGAGLVLGIPIIFTASRAPDLMSR